jgi:alpha-L-rhamnosidase
MDVAEEALYNFWSAPMFELFLDTIRAQQVNSTGNLPVNVPSGAPKKPMDISWTAAYPLIAQWLLQYYGDLSVARAHWPNLKLFVDGQRKQMKGDDVPDFYNFGDWCAIESRKVCTPNTGPPAAAANYILSVEAMVTMAEALGETEDQARYSSWLAAYRTAYHRAYWNSSLASYGKTALEIQTMSTVALGAGAVPAAKQATVTSALLQDISARDNHLTVGATGQKWLLRTLTAAGAAGHDTALKVATQDTYPGWGYWVSQGKAHPPFLSTPPLPLHPTPPFPSTPPRPSPPFPRVYLHTDTWIQEQPHAGSLGVESKIRLTPGTPERQSTRRRIIM